MGFVDGNAAELLLRIDGLQVPAEGLRLTKFRRHVEEADAWVTASQVVEDGVALCNSSV